MNDESLRERPSLVERLIRGPVGFRERLQRLGPTFIKIGQYLALRPDLIPQEYCDELMRLLDQVPPFPWHEARAIIKEDLGADPDALFAYINPRPVGSGALAQTYLARLDDGTELAVKVQRPNIREQVLRDLERTQFLAKLFQVGGVSLLASPKEIAAELGDWLMQEIDYRRELGNVTRLYELTAGSPYERVPRPYPDFSGPRVVTVEYLRGVRFSELLVTRRSDRPADQDRIAMLGVDCDRLAENLVAANLRQMFRYEFFHADLHPGNLLALPDDVIGFVDFGLCEVLDDAVRDRQLRYLSAAYRGDSDQLFKALSEILTPGERTDMEAFRRDFMAETRHWARQTRFDGSDRGEHPPVAEHLIGLMRAARRNELQVPPGILAMYRAFFTAETVAQQLGPQADLQMVGERFFTTLQIDAALESLEPDNLQPVFRNLLALWRDAPRQIQQVLSDLSDGTFSLNVYVTETSRTRLAANRRVRLVVTAILSVGVALLLARPGLPSVLGVSLAWPLAVILALLYISIYRQWRYLQ